MGKRISPFSKEFWINKGYSEEDAIYKCNSIRPIKKEYWIERGYSEKDAEEKAKNTKNSNNRKGAEKSSKRSKDDIYKTSVRRIEYWIDKGYSKEEAKEKIKKNQTNFSLEICIEKFGLLDGYKIWKSRQYKWQNTLNSKSKNEIEVINKNKNCIRLDLFESIEDCIISLKKTRNMDIYISIDEFKVHINNILKKYPYFKYYPLDLFILKKVSNIQIEIFKKLSIDVKDILKNIIIGDNYKKFLMKNGKKQSKRMWTDEGLLRSSYEIYFYEQFKSKFPNINIKIDKCYKNSTLRYDFKVENTTIEICPMYNIDEKYRIKMDKKQKLFKCILLKSIEEIDLFIENWQNI